MKGMPDSLLPNHDETLDSLACGGVSLFQKKRGYRYSLDAYLLAAFVREQGGTRALEIGSGSGVISLLLAAVKGLLMTGVEIQEAMAEMSRRSVALAGLDGSVEIVSADIRGYAGPREDVVVVNPPYRPRRTGRVNPDEGKAVARHEISLTLEELMERSHALLRNRGRLYLVYPAWRLADLMSSMRAVRIEPKEIMLVHSTPGSNARICLVCGVKNGGRELAVRRPFFVFAQEGIYTREMEEVFRELALPKTD
jgi:tRNA1Val (adenine37-N6)-methyltransferase